MIPPELKHIAVEKALKTHLSWTNCVPINCLSFFKHHRIGLPRHSTYGVFTYIYPLNYPNVGKYTIHWEILFEKNDGISGFFFGGGGHTHFEGVHSLKLT